MTEKQVVKYDVTEAAISEMRNLYIHLTVEGIDDEKGFEEVELARKVVKGKRIAVEKQRVVFKSDALTFGRLVDSEAKKVFALLEPIETHLIKEGDKIRDEEKRIEAEEEAKEKAKTQGRVDDLLKVNIVLDYFTVATMTDEDYDTFYATSRTNYEAVQARIVAEEKAKAEKEEAERLEREAESKRLADEKKRLEKWDKEQKEKETVAREKQEKVRLELEAKEAELKIEQKRIDDAKKAEKEAKARVEFEKKAQKEAIAHAAKQAEEEALWAVEQERLEAEEKERKKALLPIRDRLYDYADDILKETPPVFEDEPGNAIVRWAVSEIKELSGQIKVRADAL